ncbi:hypothetical protein M8523_13965 [Hyphomicrobiales bacterium BP6-180914]|uniref:AsmA-like C-terminal domain-containing protein n=2 Tax=Lichenifustis flavocetrariae TaxID=2949735 RepID=A0AA41YXL9_9HYPH|nr:hypothetical protein [Lichenifustis flavocetrariae]
MAASAPHALQRLFGSRVTIGGPIEARLFPRPHIVMTDISLNDDGHGVRLDVPQLEATQSLTSLVTGRLGFSQLRLSEPTASIDEDRLSSLPASSAIALLGHAFPGRIVLSSGVVALRSSNPAASGLLIGLNAVVEGLDRNGVAALSGHGTWRGQRVEMSAHLAPFFDFLLGRETSGSVRLHLPLLSASVDGQLHAGIRGGFDGKVSASTASLATLLRSNDLPAGIGRVVGEASFSGSGVANQDSLTFSDTHLVLDKTDFEGSLAWQPNQGHGAWTGTFATDRLDLTHAFDTLPDARSRDGRWSDKHWALDASLWDDVDLRVSANRATFGPIDVEDAAFSALCRDGRVEISLSEARSLDGLIRGRAVASLGASAVDLKVDLSMSQLDLEPLSGPKAPRGLTGSASGHFQGDAHGGSPKALIESLTGHGQISVRQGSLPPLQTIADLSATQERTAVLSPLGSLQQFDLGTADLDVDKGLLKIENGRLLGPAFERVFRGEISFLDHSMSLATADATPEALAAGRDVVTTSFAGQWGQSPRVLRLDQVSAPPRLLTRSPGAVEFLP